MATAARHSANGISRGEAFTRRVGRSWPVRQKIVTVPLILIVLILTVAALHGGGSSNKVTAPDTPPSLAPASAFIAAAHPGPALGLAVP
jgi:hypothetical protein